MQCFIHSIETEVPETALRQDYIRQFMREHVARSRLASLTVQRIYAHSAIDQRHSALHELGQPPRDGIFFDAERQQIRNPPTGDRNDRYQSETIKLLSTLPARAIRSASFRPGDVTHIITASCTGFFAPGPDFHIIRSLDLPPTVQAYHLGYMGCYAAFPAMRLAQHICASQPEAVVLIVCHELCTLHLQFTDDPDALLAASIFADGAAAAIVTAQPPTPDRKALSLDALHTTRTPEGERDMAWTIGNTGFDMVLTPKIPALIRKYINDALRPYTSSHLDLEAIKYWAVHPGGRAILDAVQASHGLADERLAPSRETLREYGNMSSATIWFVLRKIMQQSTLAPAPILAMAFGPGLTIESGLLHAIPAQNASTPHALAATSSK